MNFDIQKEFMSQSSYFKSRPDLVKLEGETGNLGKRLEWKGHDEIWWEEAHIQDT